MLDSTKNGLISWVKKDALHDLITKQWRTDESATTDAHGEFSTRVFLGEYQIAARDKEGHQATRIVRFDATQKASVSLQLNQESHEP